MKAFVLTHKDLLELKHWLTCDLKAERAKGEIYLSLFKLNKHLLPWNIRKRLGARTQVLEVGTGPFWGILPYIEADRRVGIDPLIDVYYALGILDDRKSIQYYNEDFVTWDSNDTFDAIFCANSLDHGGMGFHLLPKLANLLKPGGLLYIYVHLRCSDQLNLIHDHSLTLEQLDKNLKLTDLKTIHREEVTDFEQPEFSALIGVWSK